MKVMRRSPLTKITETRDLPITPEQIARYNEGALIQDAFSNLTPGEREFLKTGYTEDDWRAMFSEDASRESFVFEACRNGRGHLDTPDYHRAIAFIGVEPEDRCCPGCSEPEECLRYGCARENDGPLTREGG